MISKNESMYSSHKNRFSKLILEDSKVLCDELSRSEQNVNKLKEKLKENKGKMVKKKAIIRSRNRGDYSGV